MNQRSHLISKHRHHLKPRTIVRVVARSEHTNIEPVDPGSDLLSRVRSLWRRNSNYLGFFPDGAFEDHALKGWILAAKNNEEELLGFLTYRESRHQASIVHLCVRPEARRSGVARGLLQALRTKLRLECQGIKVRCRRDFPANAIWPSLGFVPVNQRRGRASEAAVIDVWWQDLRRPDLFTRAQSESFASTIPIVIDAQIFFDLEVEGRTRAAEVKALATDWMQEEVSIWLTDEILVEIDRDSDARRKSQLRAAYQRYSTLKDEPHKFDRALRQLTKLLGAPRSKQSASDLRHLARTLSGGVTFFVTRDEAILRAADLLYKSTGLTIVHPADLLPRISELQDEARYRPVRLQGTELRVSKWITADIQAICDLFLHTSQGERKGALRSLASELNANDKAKCGIVRDPNGGLLAAYAIELGVSGLAKIRLLRVQDGPLAPTLARFLLVQMTHQAVDTSCSAIYFEDLLTEEFRGALVDCGFTWTADGWARVATTGVYSARRLTTWLHQTSRAIPQVASHCAIVMRQLADIEPESLVTHLPSLEKHIRPAFILDPSIPAFIVPIRPTWAMYLFDDVLAASDLFGSTALLALRHENVYYRAAKPLVQAPSHAIWYVSSGRHDGVMSARAISTIEEVAIDSATLLYKRFRRLGVYEWQNVLETARGDPNAPIMALRFSGTVMLSRPVPLAAIRRVLGKSHTLQSPLRIQSDQFARIVEIGGIPRAMGHTERT